MTSRIHAFGAATLTAAALVLAACSPPNQQDTTMEKSDTASDVAAPSQSNSSTTKNNSSQTSSRTADAEANIAQIEVSPTTNLRNGDEITVKLSGLDPSMGYYAAVCAAETAPGNPVPVCTGQTGDTEAQAWIKSEGGTVNLASDGSATATLVAAAAGEGIDCTTDSCVVKLFGDHTQGFVDIADVPVTFAR